MQKQYSGIISIIDKMLNENTAITFQEKSKGTQANTIKSLGKYYNNRYGRGFTFISQSV